MGGMGRCGGRVGMYLALVWGVKSGERAGR